MGENDADRTVLEPEQTTSLGPADGVLFDTFDARLVDLDVYATPDGSLIATTPDASSVVRLEATDRGLAATETTALDPETEDLERLDRIDPAVQPDVDAGETVRTRLRGD